jgi:hypothetical protein
VAPSFGVELRPLDLHDPGGIVHDIAALRVRLPSGLVIGCDVGDFLKASFPQTGRLQPGEQFLSQLLFQRAPFPVCA